MLLLLNSKVAVTRSVEKRQFKSDKYSNGVARNRNQLR